MDNTNRFLTVDEIAQLSLGDMFTLLTGRISGYMLARMTEQEAMRTLPTRSM